MKKSEISNRSRLPERYRAVWHVVALALSCAGATSTWAQTVTLRPAPAGVVAHYDLAVPSDRFVFTEQDAIRTEWSPTIPSVMIGQDGIRAVSSLKQFDVLVQPDKTEEGRGYIALTRLGEGYILYAPALQLEGQNLRLEVDTPENWTLLPGPTFDGYVYLGPTAAVSRTPSGGFRIGPETSSVVDATLFEAYDSALQFFNRVFGPLPYAPTMAITRQGSGPIPFRGDVTDSGVISIRLHGDLGEPDAEAREQIQHFAFHETSHFWNSHLAKPEKENRWLHEGGAEYLALVAAVSTGRLTEERARAHLSQSLTDCVISLSDRPEVRTLINSGAAVYACGTILQWLADLELRQDLGRRDGVVSVWAEWIEKARDGQVEYGPEDLESILGRKSAVAVLLDGPARSRLADLTASFSRLQVEWVNKPSNSSLLSATLRHIKRQACAGGLSYFVRAGSVEMENGADCGVLSGNVRLATVEGHDPVVDTAVMFQAVQQKCAQGQAVALTLGGTSERFEIPCATNLVAPTAYSVTRAPNIGLLSESALPI